MTVQFTAMATRTTSHQGRGRRARLSADPFAAFWGRGAPFMARRSPGDVGAGPAQLPFPRRDGGPISAFPLEPDPAAGRLVVALGPGALGDVLEARHVVAERHLVDRRVL